MKIYVDEDGFVKVKMAKGSEVLGDFLSGDVQGSVFAAIEYINACLSVESGEASRWEGTGNAFTVRIESGGVEIFNEYTEEFVRISNISDFRAYLEEWKEYLIRLKSKDQ
ncbi:hypothetical protein LGM63_22235 [Burkholderia cepacia]|uniref:hypothetical protein n=1 Tax=Burkholderia cepacia TaxID=292 RepID=UPI00075BB786|nr:hypothetical protein [Burkholderia cepacia]KWC80671.1 hypothetical protein WL57_26635 [Burkholderia cepacia]MCA7993371.1 hypothetical protein [Burkholderia cepacia]